MTRPAKQRFVPSGMTKRNFPSFSRETASVTLATLKIGAIGSFGAWGSNFPAETPSTWQPRRARDRAAVQVECLIGRAVMVASEKPNYRHCRLLRARREWWEETAALRHFNPAYSSFPSRVSSPQVQTKWTALKGWLHLKR